MTTFTTTDIQGLGELLAIANDGLSLEDLHPNMAARHLGLANHLATSGIPRDAHAIAEAIALDVEDAGDIDQIAPWIFVRHLDTADDVLKRF
ncbi:hypothetical protein AB0A05_07475 [Streptomyces sp. NPDC046374]|uniref:hypothetical protein n=1 Tax=Streptomyces sp. NPDC046374 TaxID=3154917 RepID=UPI0033ECC3BD